MSPDNGSMSSATTASEALRMEGVRKRFGATVALDGVDLAVNAGEVVALVGENGAGKSTLVKLLSGAHRPDEGRMWLWGEPYRPRGPLDARRAGVAMIYQELSLAPHLSVAENILLGMEPGRGPLLDERELRRRAAAAMREIGHPGMPLNLPVSHLTVGERQLVEIARAVAVGSRVLILDEPTSSLARGDILRLFDLVRRLQGRGHAILYISHFLEEVKEISDRCVVLRDGRSVGGGETSGLEPDRIIGWMVGRRVEELYPRSKRSPGEIVLAIRGLAGAEKPLSASFELRRGEVLGIAGLVGAGRTELLRALLGLDPIRRGDVRVATRAGSFAGCAAPSRRWAEGMGMVSEDRKTEGLALDLTIADNVTLSRLPVLLRPSRLDGDTRRWMDRLSVKSRGPRQSVGDLSGGNQQKVAMARLLHHDADLLLLDEPTRGIDVGSKAEIYRTIDELANRGKAVLMVSNYLPELLGVCDRVAVMCRGILGPARPVGDVDERRLMLEATGAEAGDDEMNGEP